MVQIEVADYLGAVVREVRDVQRDGRLMRTVVASRAFSTSPDDLWDALTNGERLPRWFAPVNGDLRLGGRYQVVGNAGGTINACQPPRRLEVTWEFGGGISWLSLSLEPIAPGETRLTLEHTAEIDPHWGQYGPGAVGVGWDLSLVGLALHIDTAGAGAQAEGEAWSMSAEGKAFITGCAEGWGEADIARGEDPEVARASAHNTAKFYTGG